MKIGIIGAGKVGCSMGKYLCEHGISVAGFYSRSKESVESAATFTETKACRSLSELLAVSDVIFITTGDDAIAQVWESIRNQSIQGKIVCHFSGSLSSVLFSEREDAGVSACSIHPMYAFNNRFTSYKQLNQAVFTMEGDEYALTVLKPMLEHMGNTVYVISPEKKQRYHAAASMASNMMLGLYKRCIDMLADCGFSSEDAGKLLAPLVRGNVNNFLENAPEEALTGPIERCDEATVAGHLVVLTEEERDIYVNLGLVLTDLAEKKNPTRDYSSIRKRLKNGGRK
jgi:predicted short-subunit dehydrogenase-like oxidoreductase (DUF2520 family)